MSDEFAHAIAALVDALPALSATDRHALLERIRTEDARHSSAYVDIATDDEEQAVRLDIAKDVIARWLAERDK